MTISNPDLLCLKPGGNYRRVNLFLKADFYWSKDLIYERCHSHVAELLLTIIRQRGIKNIPQFSWSSPKENRYFDEHTETRISYVLPKEDEGLPRSHS